MILTGEPSGDLHAGKLVREIKKIDPSAYISGIGGPHLEQEKVDLFFHISNLSAMGVTDVLVQFRQIKQAFDLVKQKIHRRPCNLLILVDYPGFNLKVAQYVKQHYKTPILYFIAPKVWAWKKSRLKQLKAFVDHVALILPFERKIYKTAGIPATYVGNPLMDEYPVHLTKPFQKRDPVQCKGASRRPDHHITIGLLPGSRKSEVNRLLPVMLEAAVLLSRKKQGLRFIVSHAGAVERKTIENAIHTIDADIRFDIFKGPVREIFSDSNFIIAASGTVTLEAALNCVPTILIYKMSGFSFQLGKILVKLKYAGLANLIVNKEVMPEFLQQDADPEQISHKAVQMLDNLEFHENRLAMVRRFLGNKGASKRTAAIAVGLMRA